MHFNETSKIKPLISLSNAPNFFLYFSFSIPLQQPPVRRVESTTTNTKHAVVLSSPLFFHSALPRRTRAHRIRPRAGEIRAAAARSGKRRRRRKPRSCRRGSCIGAPRGRSGVSWGVAARGGARVRDPPDPSSPPAAAVVGAAMEADAPLDFALFQLSPRRQR